MGKRKKTPTRLDAFRSARRTWSRNPVTRVKASRKLYARARSKRELELETR